jgi:hypothetical protein
MKTFALLLTLLSLNISAKTILISDIDDTIKRTHVLGYMTGGVRTTNPFIGLPELYNAFLCNKEESVEQKNFCISKKGVVHSPKRWVSYVTAASGRLQMFGREFIARSNFPFGAVKGKTSAQDSYKFKTQEIASQINSLMDFEIVLIGDNGQKDVAAYDHIRKKYPFKNITTYIHKVYSTYNEDKAKRGVNLAKGQIAYLTAVDLGLEFYSKNLITEDDLYKVSKKVLSFVSSSDDDLYEQVIPDWVNCASFAKNYIRPNVSLEAKTEKVISKVERRVRSLCRGRW